MTQSGSIKTGVLTSNSAFLAIVCTPVWRMILDSILCVAGIIASNLKNSGKNCVT